MKVKPTVLLLFAGMVSAFAEPITPVPENINCAVPDRQDAQIPDRVRESGWVGWRSQASISNRLEKVDLEALLEGFRHRPGRQDWIGEHAGKWLHAATLEWVNSSDPVLRAKMDYVATELAKCQMPDGYLGTYQPTNRWTSWDVWTHKYDLIGLITYMRYTGETNVLPTCTRMADLLCKTFGDEPGKRDIIQSGEHVGLAPTSVLEPMILLYRLTGQPRYLDFCKYILRSWEQPDGPHVMSTLLSAKRVDKVGDAKAYEMLSCLNGALEYYRTTGDTNILAACLNAWQDIVDHRIYPTGAMSYNEVFHDDFDFPNTRNVGETCVTVTWIQFNAQLLRLTGEARFAEQLERVILNQLLGAQTCDGSGWGYYVGMEGIKPYYRGEKDADGVCFTCCLSSGPRGLALVPTFAVTTDADGAVVNLYESGQANLTLRSGTPVKLETDTLYPGQDKIRITVSPATSVAFAIKLRVPAWCHSASVKVNDHPVGTKPDADGYVKIRRNWKAGDQIDLNLKQEAHLIVGDHLNQGKVAILYGPLVLTADAALLLKDGQNFKSFAIPGTDAAALGLQPEPAPEALKTWPGARVFRVNAVSRKDGSSLAIRLIPFADAGSRGSRYEVWLPLPRQPSGNQLRDGLESLSRPGNQTGSFTDEDTETQSVTYTGQPAQEDWFAVTLDGPVEIRRIVFMHGSNYHDGGWFDTSAGKPKVEVQREKGGTWETVGELRDYPATTATNNGNLQPGQAFTLRLANPLKIVAVRVVGAPACGDNPKQNFSSCAELQAYSD